MEREGFGHLVPLLEAPSELELLEILKAFAQNPESPPADFEILCHQYQISPQIIPPEKLFGICGEQAGRIAPTPIGSGLARVIETCPINLLLTEGSAAEIAGVKPLAKKREGPPSIHSFSPELVRRGLLAFPRGAPPPPIDLDILMVTPDPTLSLETVRQELAKGPLRRGAGARVYIKASKRRPRIFERIEVATTRFYRSHPVGPDGTQKWELLAPSFSFGHLFFPEDSRTHYGPENRLLVHLMSRSTLGSVAILLVPIRKNGKLVSFRGVEINFFDYQQWVRRVKVWERTFSLATYLFPEFAFPQQNSPEMLDHFFNELNTWSWSNALPLAELNRYGKTVFHPKEAAFDPKALRMLSQRAANWFAERIVYPLAANPDLLGHAKQQKEQAEELLTTLKSALDGDPFLTTIRCLSPEKRIPGSPAFGMGIFEAFFPELSHFLNEIKLDLRRWEVLVSKMEKCPYGPAKKGWETFLDFLFQETGNDPQKVAQFLTPVIYPGNPRKYLEEILAPLDPRFAEVAKPPKRPSRKERILAAINSATRPLTSQEVVELAQIPTNPWPALRQLEKEGLIVQLGGRRGRKTQGRVGTGGRRAFWATPEVAAIYEPLLPTPQEAVMQAIREGATTVRSIQDRTGIKDSTVRLAVRRLEKTGLVRISRTGQGRPLLISPTDVD